MIVKGVQVGGKRDDGKCSVKVAELVTVTVTPLERAASRCSRNNTVQECGGVEAEQREG